MRIDMPGRGLAFDTEDIRYDTDCLTLGTPGNYEFRCKPTLVREYYGNRCEKQRLVNIKVDYCFGKTLAEMEANAINAIKRAWEKHHQPRREWTLADVMWM